MAERSFFAAFRRKEETSEEKYQKAREGASPAVRGQLAKQRREETKAQAKLEAARRMPSQSKFEAQFKAEERFRRNKPLIKAYEREQRYRGTRTQKVGAGISKAFSFIRNPAEATYTKYPQQVFPKPKSQRQTHFGRYTGRVGRPKGTYKHFDPQTGQSLGIYEYRMLLRQRLRKEKAEYLRNLAITPQQKEVLARIEARKRYQSQNKETKIIPDTDGSVFLSGINQEINDAAGIID